MVFYECVLTAKNTARTSLSFQRRKCTILSIYYSQTGSFLSLIDFDTLTRLVKKVSHQVVDGGGIVRSIRNHGIRDLPHRFRAKFPDTQGNRYYKKGRFISIYYDASPGTMRQVESVITLDDTVLRQTHLKARSKLDYVNNPNERKNPYIQEILQEDYLAEQAAKAAAGEVEETIES